MLKSVGRVGFLMFRSSGNGKKLLGNGSDRLKCQNMRHFSFGRINNSKDVMRYSEKHEWVKCEGKVGTVGITDYAQEALGDIVYAQLPEQDTEYALGEECGAVESVKAASELYCPLTGKVTETNAEVADNPSLINTSPYQQGWLFKLELKDPKELDSLMEESAYAEFIKTIADNEDN